MTSARQTGESMTSTRQTKESSMASARETGKSMTSARLRGEGRTSASQTGEIMRSATQTGEIMTSASQTGEIMTSALFRLVEPSVATHSTGVQRGILMNDAGLRHTHNAPHSSSVDELCARQRTATVIRKPKQTAI